MSSPPPPLTLSALLAEHSDDPHAALSTLLGRFNRLLSDYSVLRQEKENAERSAERSAVENQQLWRSLKAMTGSSSPRPPVRGESSLPSRQNSEGGNTVKGLGIGGSGDTTPASRGLRRGLSSESNPARLDLPNSSSASPSHNSSPRFGFSSSTPVDFEPSTPAGTSSDQDRSPRLASNYHFPCSSSPLRAKAATPPPNGSPRHMHRDEPIGASGLRKASSLDLGRGSPPEPDAEPTENSPSSFVAPPVHMTLPDDYSAAEPKTPPPPSINGPLDRSLLLNRRRQSSPRISGSASMPMIANSDAAGGNRSLQSIQPVSPFFNPSPRSGDRDEPMPTGSAAGEQLQQQLQGGSGVSKRDRTFSAASAASLPLGSAFDASQQQQREQYLHPTRSSSTNIPSSSSSSHLAESALPRERERRPSAPASKLSQTRSAGDSSGDSYPSTFCAPVSRRPSGTAPLPALPSHEDVPLPPPPPAAPPVRPVLTPSLLPFARVRIASSNIRMNEKHKEVISFVIEVELSLPSSPSDIDGPAGSTVRWRVEKLYSDILALDSAVKNKTNRQETKNMTSLPDKSLFKDHAPHKSDQRKAVLERYLQTLVSLPLRDRSAVCAFLNSDIASDPPSPSSSGPMAGWLTKRGRAFGGWQTRYYVLTPGSTLTYYDAPGGNKHGEIPLHSATIGRQSSRSADPGEDAYLHAFLIRTKDEKEQEADHILCAENDDIRDAWVVALTTLRPKGGSAKANGGEKEKERGPTSSGSAPPIPTVVSPEPEPSTGKERRRSGSGPSSVGGTEQQNAVQDPRTLSARSAGDLPPSYSLPSNLDAFARGMPALDAASNRGIGTIPEDGPVTREPSSSRTGPTKLQAPPSRRPAAQNERPLSPDRRGDAQQPPATPSQQHATKYSASDVSGPMNAVPLPSGYDFKKIERQKKTKSSFWNFASRNSSDKGSPGQSAAAPARPVFGVPLKEAVAISRIRPGLELPAIVYRCVEYLEAKNAEHEEGIFRLSGSANVIRLLKDRFNAEGDVNLLQSTEYYDPHAIAGLLKQYLRELPVHLLTRELHGDFLRVIDLRNRRDRVNALGKLVAQLPIEEYTLFRFFFAHLCLIAQNAETSKMNLRNLGIVFSPTLAIPAPLFSLFLSEFDLVFAVESETGTAKPITLEDETTEDTTVPQERRTTNRNSQIYEASGANKLMESELRRLKENDEEEAAGDLLDESNAPEETTRVISPSDGDLTTSTSYDLHYSHHVNPSLVNLPAPPRSPGLPASPRPGATFQT
ncbi:Rho GTPase activating protein [Rhodotorula toruloides]